MNAEKAKKHVFKRTYFFSLLVLDFVPPEERQYSFLQIFRAILPR